MNFNDFDATMEKYVNRRILYTNTHTDKSAEEFRKWFLNEDFIKQSSNILCLTEKISEDIFDNTEINRLISYLEEKICSNELEAYTFDFSHKFLNRIFDLPNKINEAYCCEFLSVSRAGSKIACNDMERKIFWYMLKIYSSYGCLNS